jgi:hypothetical protein
MSCARIKLASILIFSEKIQIKWYIYKFGLYDVYNFKFDKSSTIDFYIGRYLLETTIP